MSTFLKDQIIRRYGVQYRILDVAEGSVTMENLMTGELSKNHLDSLMVEFRNGSVLTAPSESQEKKQRDVVPIFSSHSPHVKPRRVDHGI